MAPIAGLRIGNGTSLHRTPALWNSRSLYGIGIAVVGLFWITMIVVTLEFLPNAPDSSSLILRGDKQQIIHVGTSRILQTHQDCPLTHLQRLRKPEFTYSLRNPLKSSPYHILHTVVTRFMIGQPHQPILARARYMLFETFCWPTMKYQTRQNFYWIILVDPRLDPEVIADIQTLLTSSPQQQQGGHGMDVHFPSQNAFLVLTENTAWAADGVGVRNLTSYGVGLQELAREYRDGNVVILSGNTYHLMRALELFEGSWGDNKKHKTRVEDKNILMIETLLDADDGLNIHGIEWIQDLAIAHATQQQRQLEAVGKFPTLNSTWWILCGTDHIEWHNRDIYKLTNSAYQTMGVTAGIAGVRHAPLFCASAGYTRVGLTLSAGNEAKLQSAGNNATIRFPQKAYRNHALARSFPFCNDTQMSECLRREFEGKPYILKSRSITSDSMDHLNPKSNE
jgi:hypothetical protein